MTDQYFTIQSFNNLFSEYQGRFVNFAKTYVRNSIVAEDIVADAFISYWENREQLREESNIPAYILTSVKNKCINHLQQLRTREMVEEELKEHNQWELNMRIASLQACEPYEIFTKEIQQIVNQTLEKLPEQTRRIFLMSRYQNLSHKEIAENMNLSTKSIEFHISKTIKALRISLKDFLPAILLFWIWE